MTEEEFAPIVSARHTEYLVDKIRPILAGASREVQCAALADCLAILMAGHPPFVRQRVLAALIKLVWKLVPINEHMMFGDAGHPNKEEPN